MSIVEIIMIGVSLSMDAFAVSVGKGLSLKNIRTKEICTAGVWFGGFQFLMPVIGYYIGSFAAAYVSRYDHWIAFILLALIGGNMIRDSFSSEGEQNASMNPGEMLVLAVATSIDALAVGVSFAMMNGVNVWFSSGIIGCVTFTLSCVGVKFGSTLGSRFESRAKLAGGIILVLIGLKILLQDLGVF